jgi:ribonuclease T1
MIRRIATPSAVFILFICFCLLMPAQVLAESCEKVVHAVNAQLAPKIDEQELVEILRNLNKTNNKQLPPKFVTKQEARTCGWKPGKDLWSVNALRGSSMGGDRFRNLEGRLPKNKWREADLDYKGGHRGAKRFIFSRDGKRFVTVDHYRTFTEVSSCR